MQLVSCHADSSSAAGKSFGFPFKENQSETLASGGDSYADAQSITCRYVWRTFLIAAKSYLKCAPLTNTAGVKPDDH